MPLLGNLSIMKILLIIRFLSHLFRFATHLVLFFMDYEIEGIPETRDEVLFGYIHHLITSKHVNIFNKFF